MSTSQLCQDQLQRIYQNKLAMRPEHLARVEARKQQNGFKSMSRDLSKDDAAKLEELLDRSDLRGIVDALCSICVAKVQHLETNWQDKELANLWARQASKLARFHPTLEKMP